MLKPKFSSERKLVKRNFRGAKIVEIENTRNTQKTFNKILSDKSEPESVENDSGSFLPRDRRNITLKGERY